MKATMKRSLLIPNTLVFNKKVEDGEEPTLEDESGVLRESILYHMDTSPEYVKKEFRKVANYFLAEEMKRWDW